METLTKLQRIGLTEGEAKVYVALLQLGSSTVGPVAMKSRVAYSKIYEILARLQEKGLVSIIIRSKTRHYQAISPRRIDEYLRKKEEDIRDERTTLSELIPTLELMQGLAAQRTEAEVFVGWKSVYAAEMKLIDTAKRGDEVLYFYIYDAKSNERSEQLFSTLNHEYRRRGLKLRGVSDPAYKKSPFVEHTPIKKMRYAQFPIPNNIDICNDKVIIASWKMPLAILITSQEIADNFRNMFEDIWKKAKP